MERIQQLIDDELKKLGHFELQLALALGNHFPESYGQRAYNLDRLARGWSYPGGQVSELYAYVEATYAVTYLRDAFRCVYCEMDGLESAEHYAAMQVDHLAPVGPKDPDIWNHFPEDEWFIRGYSPDNLACACSSCNASKSNHVLKVTTLMPRPERLKRAVAAERARRNVVRGQPSASCAPRYASEVREVAAFVAAYRAVVGGRSSIT